MEEVEVTNEGEVGEEDGIPLIGIYDRGSAQGSKARGGNHSCCYSRDGDGKPRECPRGGP